MGKPRSAYPPDRDLVYRKAAVATFAPRHIADWVNRIHDALHTSNTWAEFRRKMPADEYERLLTSQFDEDSEPRPSGRAKFEYTMISGAGDGDYPPWLAPRMNEWIPAALLERYATWQATSLNGSYWEIAEEDADRLADELRALGYRVTEEPDQDFY